MSWPKITLTNNNGSFSSQFGSTPNGSLKEQRDKLTPSNKSTAADVISATAGGLDSVTGFINALTGNNPPQVSKEPIVVQNQQNQPLPFHWKQAAGVVALVALLFVLMYFTRPQKRKPIGK